MRMAVPATGMIGNPVAGRRSGVEVAEDVDGSGGPVSRVLVVGVSPDTVAVDVGVDEPVVSGATVVDIGARTVVEGDVVAGAVDDVDGTFVTEVTVVGVGHGVIVPW